MIQLLKTINQGIYFLLEIYMLGALGYVGFQSSQTTFWQYKLAIGLPSVVALLWGIFAAPRSDHRLALPYRALFALVLFTITALLLYRCGQPAIEVINKTCVF